MSGHRAPTLSHSTSAQYGAAQADEAGCTAESCWQPPAEAAVDENHPTSTSSVSAIVDSSEGAQQYRPTDEEILGQQNLIRAEQAERIPYVSQKEPLSSLKSEYSSGNDVFLRKIEKLEQTYSSLRRTRGDGNCFFRAFIFSYLENLLLNNDVQECNRLSECIQSCKQMLLDHNYQELVFEDAMELLLDQIHAIGRPVNPMTLDILECNFRDDTVSNMVVMFLRLITSCELQRREDFFAPFIMGMYDDPPATVELFCQRFVEPIGEESDHVHIVALTDALKVPVQIVYLDRSGALQGSSTELDINAHDFVPELLPAGTRPQVHLLYRPGHYDILYCS